MNNGSLNITERLLLDEINENRSPSIQYALFNKDSIIRRYTFGQADIENKMEANWTTTYNAYSVTKTFTALAILQLAQQDKLSIEHPIKKYLPGFPYDSEITIKQVLSHSAGIPNPIPLGWIHLSSENKLFNRDEFFKNILSENNRLKSKPNENYAYSNLGYILLGQLIENVSGEKYEDYIQNYIIKPLGIPVSELGFEIHDYGKHARGYHKRYSFSNFILGFFIDKSKYMDKSGSKWKPFRSFYVNGPSYGGLIGTAESFIKYLQELLNPNSKLISDDFKKMIFTENINYNSKPTGMCLSWFKGQLNGENYYTHAGGGGGYYCEIRIYPDLGIGSVVFFNRTGMSDQRFLSKIDKIYLDNVKR
jgi:CubicO group peptidase (beta-lactamase class C family)